MIEMTGQKIGKLKVIKDSGKRYGKNKEIIWECLCDCGNICEVRGCHLRNGQVQSCNCLQKQTLKKYNELRHIYKVKSLKTKGYGEVKKDVKD